MDKGLRAWNTNMQNTMFASANGYRLMHYVECTNVNRKFHNRNSIIEVFPRWLIWQEIIIVQE